MLNPLQICTFYFGVRTSYYPPLSSLHHPMYIHLDIRNITKPIQGDLLMFVHSKSFKLLARKLSHTCQVHPGTATLGNTSPRAPRQERWTFSLQLFPLPAAKNTRPSFQETDCQDMGSSDCNSFNVEASFASWTCMEMPSRSCTMSK